MPMLRPLLPALSIVLLNTLVSACSDRESPTPPPRVPKPKVEHEPVDPIKTGPVQDRRSPQV